MRPSVTSPTGTVIGAAGVDNLDAARQAVGRVHGDATDPVVAQVLLDLDHERACLAVVDLERVVDLRQLSGNTASMTTPWISSIRPVLAFAFVAWASPCSCSWSWLL